MDSSALSPLPLKYIEGTAVSSPLPDLGNLKNNPARSENERMRQLEKMLNEAQGRSEQLERETYDKAYSAGEQAGMDLGKKRAEQMLETMQSLVKQCENSTRQLQEQADQAILDISESIIRHIIDSVLEEHPEYLQRMIEQAVSRLPKFGTLQLAVSNQDIAMFERILGETPAILKNDDSLEPGTCRIMSKDHDTLIDPQAAISECMHHIRRKLLLPRPQATESAIAKPDDAGNPENNTPES